MLQLSHADDCENADGDKVHFYLRIAPRHETDQISFHVGEQCGACFRAVMYAGDTIPSWRVSRGFISRIHTWWTTFASRNSLWETTEVWEDREPPF